MITTPITRLVPALASLEIFSTQVDRRPRMALTVWFIVMALSSLGLERPRKRRFLDGFVAWTQGRSAESSGSELRP